MGEYVDKLKGKIKQAVGGLTGNKEIKREGERDELKGRAEGAIAEVKGAAKGVKRSIKDAAK